MKKYRGRIVLTAVLEFDLETEDSIEAYEKLKEHESRILSTNWQAEGANKCITSIKETAYTSTQQLVGDGSLRLK